MSDSDELAKLADLHQRGALSDDEFLRAKARLLGAYPNTLYQARTGGALITLRRSRDDRWLGGVCGGLGHFTDTPSWIWRLLFVAAVVCAGTGVLAYFALWVFVPAELPATGPARQAY